MFGFKRSKKETIHSICFCETSIASVCSLRVFVRILNTKKWIKYEIYGYNWISFRFECEHKNGMNVHNELIP